MSSKNRYNGLNSYVIKSVHKKARQLNQNSYLSLYEQEDLEQEMMAYLLTRLPLSDLNGLRSECGIIKKLVEEKATKIIRHAASQKRGRNCVLCFFYDPTEEENTLLLEVIPETATFYEEPFANVTRAEQQREIKHIVDKMPPTLGELCELLQEMTITEVHRMKGVSRQSLYRSIARIRNVFMEAEINIYWYAVDRVKAVLPTIC